MTVYCWTFESEEDAQSDLDRINNYLELEVTKENGYYLSSVDIIRKVSDQDKWYFYFVTKTFLGCKPSILNNLVQKGTKEEFNESWLGDQS